MAAEIDNSTNRFEVDGVQYETPEYTDLTIDDWNLVYDECQVVFMDFGPLVDDAEGEKARIGRLRNPRLEQAFLMIGYMRAHPEATVDEAREVTGRARLVALLEAQQPEADEGDEADPPTGGLPTNESEPNDQSLKSSDDTSSSSSPDSKPSLEIPDGLHAITGTGG